MSSEARVGVVTVLAFLLFLGLIVWLRGDAMGPGGYQLHVRLRDAAGIEAGTPVRMSGVTVGEVTTVTLTPENLALLTITVKPGVSIPVGSRFRAATTGLVGERYLAILPGPAGAPELRTTPQSPVVGDDPFSLERLAMRLEQISDQVSEFIGNANELVTDPQMRADLREALRNARQATALARETLAEARVVADTVRRAGDNIEATSVRVREVVDSDVAAIAGDLRIMATNLEQSSERVKAFVDETSAGGQFSQDLRETAAALRDAGQRIRRMSEDLQGVINQENVVKVREIIDEARATVKEARGVVGRAGGFMGQLAGGTSASRFYSLNYDVGYTGQRGYHNLDVTLFPEGARFYRFGVHDIGGGSRTVLQVGGRLNPSLGWRAGIYESEVGLGVDYRASGPLTLSLDAYNVNLLTLDATARYQVSPGWGLTFGGRNLLRAPTWLFGAGVSY
jgi:phospholipid/cholesterol/gamma-HCH transport system substrate-binding protein